MKIKQVPVGDLKPYDNNPRFNDDAVEYVANSIREFGFKVPIVIDKNNVVVTGHTRLKAALELGLEEVPCIVADDLTNEQVKAFRLADNKVSELANWDYDKLDLEINDIIDLDMVDFGFELELDDAIAEEDEAIRGNERFRTDDAYNLRFNDIKKTDGWYQMPTLTKTEHIPRDLIGFNYMLTSNKTDCGIHFFLDDYQFERVWNDPMTYIEKMKRFDCILTPNFSLYLDMPRAMKIWNTYRSRLIGQMAQEQGLTVIPTVCWAEAETFEFCFDGLPKDGVLAVSTLGCKSKAARGTFAAGFEEMVERLTPKTVLLYGGDIEGYDYPVETIKYKNHVTEGIKERVWAETEREAQVQDE